MIHKLIRSTPERCSATKRTGSGLEVLSCTSGNSNLAQQTDVEHTNMAACAGHGDAMDRV